ncbi:MAG TPA: hypothetical protein VFD82_01525 [Planctomycetota bacterium]|nr:hypothetical protein [Planctomycetota bacterium]
MDKHDNLTSAAGARSAQQASQGGFALLIALIATVIPLLLIMGASSISMTSRMTRLERESNDERALAAAEAGIDLAVYMASTPAGLISNSVVTRNLGGGVSFRLTPKFLLTDGRDNDDEGQPSPAVDEQPDENIWEIQVVGTYRNTSRRIAAYLGPQPPLPYTVTGALMMTGVPDPGELQVYGFSRIRGFNYNFTTGAVTGSGDVAGISVTEPHTVPELLSSIPLLDRPNIMGTTPSPSLSTTAQSIDLAEIQLSIQNSANIVLTNSTYSNLQFGRSTPAPGQWNIIYRAGNVRFMGNTRGAGIMFITGDLRVEGTFRFDGIVYLLGNAQLHGTSCNFYGTVVTGPDTSHFELAGTSHVKYSSQAISLASAVLPTKYLVFNGWQELSRP